MKKIAIYTRKSVYVENSESIETQINMCKAYFTRQFKDCEFEIFEDEGFSGKNTDRPAFKRLMNLCKLKKFDAVAVYKIDRLARNIVDFMNIYDDLEKLEIKLISITEGFDPTTPIGRMMMVMLAGFADMERMNIAQRVKDNMISLAKKGCFTGGKINRGYCLEEKSDGKKYLKLENPEFIKFTFESFDKGFSLLEILRMQKDKFGSYALGSTMSVKRMLRSPVYVQSSSNVSDYLRNKGYEIVGNENKNGYLPYGVTVNEPCAIVSKHKAVIEPLLWLRVNSKLDKVRENAIKKDSKCYWLTGVLKCPICGENYVLANSRKKTYYTCSTRLKRGANRPNTCTNSKYVDATGIEAIVENTISKLFNKDTFNSSYSKNEIIYEDNTLELEKKIKSHEKSIKSLVEKLTLIDNSAAKYLTDKIEELTKEISEIKIKIEENKLNKLENELNKSTPEIIYNNIINFVSSNSPQEKRRYLKLIFKSIYYNPETNNIEVDFI
ncbi:TPA: recombinase family protein [Clostridium perfringens]|uniref:recombinase family protein n=1 Tax=Clostridium perfringens TaxID=1502 RepID=UPI000F528225|nr:recombinase family protein [Clostridium perfringens]